MVLPLRCCYHHGALQTVNVNDCDYHCNYNCDYHSNYDCKSDADCDSFVGAHASEAARPSSGAFISILSRHYGRAWRSTPSVWDTKVAEWLKRTQGMEEQSTRGEHRLVPACSLTSALHVPELLDLC